MSKTLFLSTFEPVLEVFDLCLRFRPLLGKKLSSGLPQTQKAHQNAQKEPTNPPNPLMQANDQSEKSRRKIPKSVTLGAPTQKVKNPLAPGSQQRLSKKSELTADITIGHPLIPVPTTGAMILEGAAIWPESLDSYTSESKDKGSKF